MPADQLHCDTVNHYFAGGNGDFSVILDRKREYFYFLMSAYGDFEEQGIAVARMSYADRDAPVGKVFKWHKDRWTEPGLGGHLTPIFPAEIDLKNAVSVGTFHPLAEVVLRQRAEQRQK